MIFAIVGISIYFVIMMIVNISLKKIESNLQHNKELLNWLQQKEPLLKLNNDSAKTAVVKQNATTANLESSLTQTNLKVYVTSINQNDTGEISIYFEKVPFNQFYMWLSNINKTMLFTITSAQITNQKKGLVNVEISLSV